MTDDRLSNFFFGAGVGLLVIWSWSFGWRSGIFGTAMACLVMSCVTCVMSCGTCEKEDGEDGVPK